jgi:alcohol dehydrogenase class IV
MRAVHLPTRLTELGVARATAVETVAGEVNVERLANNPRRMTATAIRDLVSAVC